jgi:hypothetical protein
MTRSFPTAPVTLLSVLALCSVASADEPKKDEPKKEEAKEEAKPEETPPPSDSSKAEHPVDKPKLSGEDENKYDWRKEPGGEHGSQVASSEWLPISIGAAAGVMVGALGGAAFDDSKPVWAGPIVGGIAGGFAGGAGGAWLIRTQREKDTRTAGTICGLSIGVAAGTLMYAQIEPEGRALETVGKYGALVIAPLLGAVAGHAIAAHFYLKPPKENAPPPPAAIVPTVSPIMTAQGTTGMSIGLNAIF